MPMKNPVHPGALAWEWFVSRPMTPAELLQNPTIYDMSLVTAAQWNSMELGIAGTYGSGYYSGNTSYGDAALEPYVIERR